jgi:hypothetical protein
MVMTGPDMAWARGAALVYRDDSGAQRFVLLEPHTSVTIGRGSACDIRLAWDDKVSRLHAQLDPVGLDWMLIDDGLSRNGTFLNGERLSGRRRLVDGDTFVLGSTTFAYRNPQALTTQRTIVGTEIPTASSLSPTQRQVLLALCRPYKHDVPYATPASNQQIATEMFLSVDAVKTHLRALFQKLQIEDLPQNQKRVKLVERAFGLGLVSRRDL